MGYFIKFGDKSQKPNQWIMVICDISNEVDFIFSFQRKYTK